MCLQSAMIFCRQLSQTFHQWLRTSRCKTWCQDRLHRSFSLMFCKESLGLFQRFFRSLTQILRRIHIHIYLSHIGIHSLIRQRPEQIIRCIIMNRCEKACMKCSLSEQFRYHLVIHILRIIHRREACLLRKCIIIEPVKKQLVHSHTALYKLGRMNMKIRERRYDQSSSIIFQFHSLKFLRKSFINSFYETTLHYQIAVLKYFQLLHCF